MSIRHRPHEWYQDVNYQECDDHLTSTAGASLNGHPSWARSRATLKDNIHCYNSDASFHIESGIALPLANGDSEQRRMTSIVEMKSHLYQTLSLTVDSHSWLHVWWTSASDGHNSWEAVGGDGHSYGQVAPHRYFDAGATESLYIKSWMEGLVTGGDVGKEQGLRVWPDHLYLFY